MNKTVFGKIKNLKSSQKKLIERLFNRSLQKSELISRELASELINLNQQTGKIIAVLVDRQGSIEEVIVGEKNIVYLPDLGRYRVGKGRLRRLRLIFTAKNQENTVVIPDDILTDLEKLRLDAVVGLARGKSDILVNYAHLDLSASNVKISGTEKLNNLNFNFNDFINSLESELETEIEKKVKVSPNNRAVLVGVYKQKTTATEDSLTELTSLANTAGLEVVDLISQYRIPDPKTFIGKGKLEELVLNCLRLSADILVIDSELNPAQWRSLTNQTELKIIDRSMLILDIFSMRANSQAGRLQVELAQLKYNLPRLTEFDAGLSRLTGGIGGRGPGETKLEISRRRSRERIKLIEDKIVKLEQQRAREAENRMEAKIPLVAILGYTNAGKSTLFNQLTKSNVLVENKLFATLDTVKRKIHYYDQNGGSVNFVISDTVGFIRELPEELINAFKATLEEAKNASILLHVVDAADQYIDARKASVRKILNSLGLSDKPEIVVYNKIDLLETTSFLLNEDAVLVSAEKRIGMNELFGKIASKLGA